MSDETLLEELIAAGTPAKLVGRVAVLLSRIAVLADQTAVLEKRREADAIRQKRLRSRDVTLRHVMSRDKDEKAQQNQSNGDARHVMSRDTPSPPDGFPSDSSSLTTPPSPQSEPKEVPLSGRARGARLPIDFEPSDLLFASKLLGSATAADDELERFRDHWKAASGPNAVKRDWNAAWRNWCRRAAETRPRANGYHPTGPPPPRPGSREDRAERTANAMRILREQAYPSADDGRGGKAPGDPTTGLLPFPKYP